MAQTLARIADPALFAAPLVLCNEEHRFLVGEALRQRNLAAEAVLLEPMPRGTAPAACLAALYIAKQDPDALMLLLPCDHHIAKPKDFLAAIGKARHAASKGWLVTFGVAPDRPETGYGYIRQGKAIRGSTGCRQVKRFVEKPERKTAENYIASGDYSWNSGMFLFAAGRLLQELTRFQPEIPEACGAALEKARSDLDFLRIDAEAFARSPSISIDYAVMESTDKAAVVPIDIGWTDLGSWETFWQISETDAAGNVLIGDVIAVDNRNSLLRSDDRLLASVGVQDLIVVATTDSVLVCRRDHAQDIGKVVERLKAAGRDEHRIPSRVHRPWGSYETIEAGQGFQAKHLIVLPGASISLQRHEHRAEHWVVVCGRAEVTRGEDVFALQANQSAYIPQGVVHRLSNPGIEALHIVEVQTGDYLGEDDIERFDDQYGRD